MNTKAYEPSQEALDRFSKLLIESFSAAVRKQIRDAIKDRYGVDVGDDF